MLESAPVADSARPPLLRRLLGDGAPTLRTLATGLVAFLLVGALALAGVLERLELIALDGLFELRGPRAAGAPIVIVTIDEDTFDELDLPWPFPRALHGRLLDAVAAGRPLAIGLNILFPEPSARGPADDAALGAAVARAGNVVLSGALTVTHETFYEKTDANLPVPAVRQGAAAVGLVNHVADRDGALRRAVLRHRVGDTELPAWDTALYRLARSRGRPGAPLPAADAIVINFRGGPRTFPWVPYHRVLSGEVAPETFRDRIVLVGATTPALQDVFTTPFAPARAMPGVEVHAHVLDTLLGGDAVRAAPPGLGLVAAALAALLGAGLAARLRAVRGFLALAAVGVALLGGAFAAFAAGHLWVPSVGIGLGLVAGWGLTTVDSYVREQREKRRLARFFSPAVLREIVRHRSEVTLGPSRRVITVLFSDIRGFTSLSEQVSPEQVATMLREYLSELTEVVFRHGGTVDKYIGDCIMALYNAPFDDPDHAVNAVRTALEFQERTRAVSARWAAQLGADIRNGVGIHTGEAVVGALGSRQRLEYTAIGDTVNLASRLEGITKDFGVAIVLSESTRQAVAGRFPTRELGTVAVKGRAEPVRIHTVVADEARPAAAGRAETPAAAGAAPAAV